jgi:hypothetical protein
MKFTPEPWTIEVGEEWGSYWLVEFEEKSLATYSDEGVEFDFDSMLAENKANAKLIKNAPILFKACQIAYVLIQRWQDGSDNTTHDLQNAKMLLDGAIQQVIGEQENDE